MVRLGDNRLGERLGERVGTKTGSRMAQSGPYALWLTM